MKYVLLWVILGTNGVWSGSAEFDTHVSSVLWTD